LKIIKFINQIDYNEIYFVQKMDKIVFFRHTVCMKIETLTALGLNQKAAKLYLTALTQGTTAVQNLAEKSGLKRSNAYLHLEELVQLGLVIKVPIGKKLFYRAADPNVLLDRSQLAVAELKAALPELTALQSAIKKPQVTILEGKQGIRQIYQEMIQANNLRLWSALANINRLFADEVEMVAQAIHKNQIHTREIINSSPEHKRASKHFAALAGKTYSARLDSTNSIGNDNILYGDVSALIRIHEFDLYVVRIEDPLITQGLKALFDLAWRAAAQ